MNAKILLFDMNETTLDLGSLKARFQNAFGDERMMATWFAMLLHSSTVCALTDVQTGFATLAGVMLDTLAARMGVRLSDENRKALLEGFAHLSAHADIKPSLLRLRDAGYQTVAFSNSSLDLMTHQIEHAGLRELYDEVISVERSGSFKPDVRAYHFAAQQLGQPVEACRLIAAHDWDTHGALSAGMHAGYLDRSGAAYHPLYLRPKVFASTMSELVDQLLDEVKGVQGL
ncbi:haloacid dehalogenase type II [Kiritimatiellota bacterium B12222]|nr:haloacid dehalogenase type II [Kiritimatiellota bacterium B12222]